MVEDFGGAGLAACKVLEAASFILLSTSDSPGLESEDEVCSSSFGTLDSADGVAEPAGLPIGSTSSSVSEVELEEVGADRSGGVC